MLPCLQLLQQELYHNTNGRHTELIILTHCTRTLYQVFHIHWTMTNIKITPKQMTVIMESAPPSAIATMMSTPEENK